MLRTLFFLNKRNLIAPAAIIISFSSGIIIIFCYCSVIANYEKKRVNIMIALIARFIPVSLTLNEHKAEITQIAELTLSCYSIFLIRAIIVVILRLLGVNESIFNPMKIRITSY